MTAIEYYVFWIRWVPTRIGVKGADGYAYPGCVRSCPNIVLQMVGPLDNAAKDEDLKCWPACCQITRRGRRWNGRGANGGVEGANGNVRGANGGAPDFLTIIAQQLRNLLPAMLAQVSNQGNVGNQNGNVVNENVQGNVGNVIVNGNRVGCSYKDFLACNPKEYDGKGGTVTLTRWIEKMESVHDMSGCSIDQKVKYTAGSFVSKALMWWNSQIGTLSQEVAVSMSWNDFKCMMIQEFCSSHEMQKLESELWNHAIISGALTDEAVTNGTIKKVEKRGNVGEPSKDRNERDDNKRTRTVNAFATTVNPVGRENTGLEPSDLGFKYEIEIATAASRDDKVEDECDKTTTRLIALLNHRSSDQQESGGGLSKVVLGSECQSVKVKEFQERCNIKAFQEWYEHVGPEVASPQDGKVTRWRRDCAWLMISRCSRSQCQIQVQGTSSIQEVNDHYNIFTRESQEYELKTKDKA
ncbi:hypothetical protein Tco_0003481 [Tanacetum coccineum]